MRIIAILLCFFAWPASSQECTSWRTMEAYLHSYGQIRSDRGITATARLMRLFVNQETGVWTLVIQTPRGCTSVWAQGTGWRWLRKRQASG